MTALARTRALILGYALASAIAYCALLPLWEGFDEFYHYGYVQYVSSTLTLPTLGDAKISRELWTSLDFTPVSHFLQPYFERPTTNFQDYFHLSSGQRREHRIQLEAIDRGLQSQPSPRVNYEAKQAPLTYLLLAPFDRLLAAAPLPARVLALRLILALATVLALWIGIRRLADRLGLKGAMEAAALFLIFSCQMLYANCCHIANDALMLPWLVFFLAAVIDSCHSPAFGRAAIVGLLMTIGLLIKASLLIFVPLVFIPPALLFLRRRIDVKQAALLASVSGGMLLALAGPWYLRNLMLYHSVTATADATGGIGITELLHTAANLPWRESIAGAAHSALWNGNSSFTTFSASTLNIDLALLAVAALCYGFHARRSTPELVALAAIALYVAELILVTLSFSFATHGETNAPMPWYMQVLLAPVIAICFLGLARLHRWGKWIALANVLLWAYVALASWFAKLLPMYAGFDDPHAHFRQLASWYLQNSPTRGSILSTLCPAPLGMLYTVLAALICLLVASTLATSFSLLQRVD